MSDETRVTHVEDVTPKGRAWLAAMERVDASTASAISEAIEAYEQARERPVEVAARLLRPKPGDVIVFHVAEPLTQQEMWDYEQTLNRVLDGFEGVRAIVAECVTDITVVRDETKKESEGR